MLFILGSVFAGLAALIHVYIFVLESVRWTHPSTRRVFGTSAEDAQVTRPLAFNQGFYNLFLAIVSAVGIVIAFAGCGAVGLALTFAGVGSMLAAALVLILSDRSKARAATVQGVFPLLAVVLLVASTLI
jgi:putative membrane protein